MKIYLIILGCLLLAFPLSAEKPPQTEPSPILSFYDFENPVPSGPHTFWLREREGRVDLSSMYRVSGERSLHLREEAADGDFPEFLVYFRNTNQGAVFVQFYLLIADPEERLNIGLAGQRWFLNRERHGQAVWLRTEDSMLRHHDAESWEDLFAPQPFVWYFVDLVYDVDRGTYDLAIFQEGVEKPLVDLRNQRGYNDQNASAVRYFSFIGDFEDTGRFDYFVDDLLIATDPAVLQKPFVAPGRRRFFVDLLAGPRPKLAKTEREALLGEARVILRDENRLAAALNDPEMMKRLDRAGDEAFALGDLNLAEEIWEQLRFRLSSRSSSLILKLADVAHQRGDFEREQELREWIYGRLDFEEMR